MGYKKEKRPVYAKTGSAVDDITVNSLQADSTYTVASMAVSSGLTVSGGLTASSADVTTASIDTLASTVSVTVQAFIQGSFTTSTGAGGGGLVVSTALTPSGFHTLTSTSTTGSTGASILHFSAGTAGTHLYVAINTVAATSTPFKLYTSSSASWDSTNMVASLSTVGSGFHAVALDGTRWLMVESVGVTLGASS